MQVARISTYRNGYVTIPRIFQETFHLFGGEEVTLFPQKEKNCLLIFMGPIYSPMLPATPLRRFKAIVSDDVGASSALYQAIEANPGVRILSAQGTTTGRDSNAVGDLLLYVPQPFDDVEFVLNVLAKSDCTIRDLREHTPIELSSMAWGAQRGHIHAEGSELSIPPQALRALGQNVSDTKVIINWDTETNVLDLTFVRRSDMIGLLILFLRDGQGHAHTGEVGGILRDLGVDFLWLQINHLGDAQRIPFLLGEGHVKRWIVVADFSKAVTSNAAITAVIAEALQKHASLFYGGVIGLHSGETILFGDPQKAFSDSPHEEVRDAASSLLRWVNKLWSAEDDTLSSIG